MESIKELTLKQLKERQERLNEDLETRNSTVKDLFICVKEQICIAINMLRLKWYVKRLVGKAEKLTEKMKKYRMKTMDCMKEYIKTKKPRLNEKMKIYLSRAIDVNNKCAEIVKEIKRIVEE